MWHPQNPSGTTDWRASGLPTRDPLDRSLLLALSAGAALSATFYGTSGPGEIYGMSFLLLGVSVGALAPEIPLLCLEPVSGS